MSATATIPDLWPSDFGVDAKQLSPSTILRQQGYKLGERTHDVVFGEVESAYDATNVFGHAFFITAPFIKVRQRAIEVWHNLDGYPATVILTDGTGRRIREEIVDSVEKFIKVLREMLATPHIVQLIGSLISQARDLDDE